MRLENESGDLAWEAKTRSLNELALTLAKAALPQATVTLARFVYCAGQCTVDARDFPPDCVPVIVLRPLLQSDQAS
jgi:hypothetical protein